MKEFFPLPSGAVWMMRLWLFLALPSSAKSVLFPRIRCLKASLGWVLEPTNFDKYPTYFRNDSIMTLAQAGQFVGTGGIEEYVRFVTPTSPYCSYGPEVKAQTSSIRYNSTTGACELFVVWKAEFKSNSTYTSTANHVYLVIMSKAYIDPEELYITKIYIYFTVPWLNYFFGDVLNSDNTRNFVCGVLNNQCSNYTTAVPNCTKVLSTFPFAEGALAHVDGYTQGCRALHGVFAATNPYHHCPHLSFTPQADPDGHYKCQNSSGYQPTDLFSSEDFAAFDRFCTKQGVDPDQGYMLLSN